MSTNCFCTQGIKLIMEALIPFNTIREVHISILPQVLAAVKLKLIEVNGSWGSVNRGELLLSDQIMSIFSPHEQFFLFFHFKTEALMRHFFTQYL